MRNAGVAFSYLNQLLESCVTYISYVLLYFSFGIMIRTKQTLKIVVDVSNTYKLLLYLTFHQ